MSSPNQTYYSSRSSPRSEDRQLATTTTTTTTTTTSPFSSTSSAPRTLSSGSAQTVITASPQPNGTNSGNRDLSTSLLLTESALRTLTCQPTAENFHRIDMLVRALESVIGRLGKEGAVTGSNRGRSRSFERDIGEREERMMTLVCLRVQRERLKGLWRYKGDQDRFGKEVREIVEKLGGYAGGEC